MINERKVKRYCKDYQLIENYEIAVNDDSQMWDCHHRNEISDNKSKKQLIDEGRYYNVSPDELIFLTKREHRRLHKPSEETKRKLSELMKGNQHNKGKHHSSETKHKMSETMKESEYHKSKMKPVMCVETGEVFESVSEASRKYNLNISHISNCCNGKSKTTGGLHWCFVL